MKKKKYYPNGNPKSLRCDILRIHKPFNRGFDGLSYTAICSRCGRPLLQDSHGQWFEAYNEIKAK